MRHTIAQLPIHMGAEPQLEQIVRRMFIAALRLLQEISDLTKLL